MAMGMTLNCRWLLLVGLLRLCAAKVSRGTLVLGGPEDHDKWEYAGKFGYAAHEATDGTFAFRAKIKRPEEVGNDVFMELGIYLDEEWERQDMRWAPCASRPRKSYAMLLRKSGEWSPWRRGTLKQVVRAHIWYFAVSDCRHRMLNNTFVDLDFELQAQQFDGSHFSFELRHMLLANIITLVSLTAFLSWYLRRCLSFRRSAGLLHPVICALSGALIVQFAAHVLHTVHLWKYRQDGDGWPWVDGTADVFFTLSQVGQATLLISIGSGYTLLSAHHGGLTIFKGIAALLSLVHICIIGTGRMEGDLSSKHHEGEGLVGWAVLTLRLALLVWFLVATEFTRHKGGLRVETFLQHFRLAGSLYLLAYPLIFLVSQVLAPYLRYPVMHLGLVIMQIFSDAWLAKLFLTRGEYFQVSDLSASHLLGGLTGMSPVKGACIRAGSELRDRSAAETSRTSRALFMD